MSGLGSRAQSIGLAGTLLLAAFGCSGAGGTSTAIGQPPGSSQPSTTPAVSSIGPAVPGFVVLAQGADGKAGLWTLAESTGQWSCIAEAAGATALGRSSAGLLLANGQNIDTRPITAPGRAGAT